jgi:hypothetical protein
MRRLLFGLFLLSILTLCTSKTEQITEEKKLKITGDNEKLEMSILGVWTDNTGPNASFLIEEDSIYGIEHFELIKYELKGDSLLIFYLNDIFKAKVTKIDSDSLIYLSKYGETKMWRFKD